MGIWDIKVKHCRNTGYLRKKSKGYGIFGEKIKVIRDIQKRDSGIPGIKLVFLI